MKINMTKKRIMYTFAVTLIIVFTTTFAILMTLERQDYRNYLQGMYSKNMYDLISSVQNIRTNLGKSAIIGSREQSIIIFDEVFRYSSDANDKLHSLPIDIEIVGDTSQFLSQVGDFCYTLAVSASQGNELNDEDYKKIDLLENESYELEEELLKILGEINEGEVKWGEIRKKAGGVFAKNEDMYITEKFESIQKQIAQYPALIYDGPFSDNLLEIKPRILEQKEVSADECVKILNDLFNKENKLNIKQISSQGKTIIPSYRFNIIKNGYEKEESPIICEMSKNGGKITYLLDNRAVGEPKIDIDKATEIGVKFLDSMGYKGMIPTYKLMYENVGVINYILKQDDVVIYPDQIKLKIALDTGGIIGIEADKYLISHIENREIEAPTITVDKAKERVGKRLKIDSIRLAIIPIENNNEVLCYEFAGTYKGKNYIVYINSQTGYEQRILEIIDTPNGQLTI